MLNWLQEKCKKKWYKFDCVLYYFLCNFYFFLFFFSLCQKKSITVLIRCLWCLTNSIFSVLTSHFLGCNFRKTFSGLGRFFFGCSPSCLENVFANWMPVSARNFSYLNALDRKLTTKNDNVKFTIQSNLCLAVLVWEAQK